MIDSSPIVNEFEGTWQVMLPARYVVAATRIPRPCPPKMFFHLNVLEPNHSHPGARNFTYILRPLRSGFLGILIPATTIVLLGVSSSECSAGSFGQYGIEKSSVMKTFKLRGLMSTRFFSHTEHKSNDE